MAATAAVTHYHHLFHFHFSHLRASFIWSGNGNALGTFGGGVGGAVAMTQTLESRSSSSSWVERGGEGGDCGAIQTYTHVSDGYIDLLGRRLDLGWVLDCRPAACVCVCVFMHSTDFKWLHKEEKRLSFSLLNRFQKLMEQNVVLFVLFVAVVSERMSQTLVDCTGFKSQVLSLSLKFLLLFCQFKATSNWKTNFPFHRLLAHFPPFM